MVKHYYFTYNHTVYNVAQASTDIFKSAILEKSPYWKHCATYCKVLKQAEIDYPTRWWLLCCLADVSKGIMLYQSRESAEQALTIRV
jgi:hypothetical protein